MIGWADRKLVARKGIFSALPVELNLRINFFVTAAAVSKVKPVLIKQKRRSHRCMGYGGRSLTTRLLDYFFCLRVCYVRESPTKAVKHTLT